MTTPRRPATRRLTAAEKWRRLRTFLEANSGWTDVRWITQHMNALNHQRTSQRRRTT